MYDGKIGVIELYVG